MFGNFRDSAAYGMSLFPEHNAQRAFGAHRTAIGQACSGYSFVPCHTEQVYLPNEGKDSSYGVINARAAALGLRNHAPMH